MILFENKVIDIDEVLDSCVIDRLTVENNEL